MAKRNGRTSKDGGSLGVDPKREGNVEGARARGNTRGKPLRTLDQEIAAEGRAIARMESERAKLLKAMTPRCLRIVDFIERLRVPSGKGQGEPLKLLPFQLMLIANTYGPETARGNRRIRRALWSIARKNGKTALAAALVLVHLIGPEAGRNREVYSAATDRNQAGHIYKMVKQMIELDEELKQICACMDSVKRVICYHLGSFYQSLSADARRQHGFNPSFVIYDELAQALNRELYDVLATSFGAQEDGLLLAISTQSSDPLSVMSELADDALKCAAGTNEDPTFWGHVFTIPEDKDVFDERNWPLANPAIGLFRVPDDVRALAIKARKSPAAEAAFRNLICNQRVDGVAAFVNRADWKLCERAVSDDELIGRPCYGGLDLSKRRDLTALVLVWELADGTVAMRSYFWTPTDELAERSMKDGAHYGAWVEQGHLMATEGRTVSYAAIVKKLLELHVRYNILGIAYDRYRIDELKHEIDLLNVAEGELNLVEFGQGYKSMAPALDKFEALVVDNKLAHDGNPVMTYCLSNVKVISDPAGNRKFDKKQRNRRIDGAVAAAMALSSITLTEPSEAASIYETRGIRVL